nr:hypothetical protein [Tanacetum cinerariifolium]
MADQQEDQQQQQNMLDALLVPIDDQVKIRLNSFRIALEKSQPDVIGVEDDADFKAIEEEDEIPLVRRQNGVVIDLKMEKKKRMQKDYESSKKIKIKLAHQRKGEESVKEEVVDGDDPSQAD